MKLLWSICFCCSIFSFANAQNAKDKDGKKHGNWVIRGKDKPNLGYANDAVVEKGTYSHGRKTGIWLKFHKDGKTIKLKGNYENNRPSGNYTRYYANGNIKESGTFVEEKQQGTLTKYYKNGQISYQANYRDQGRESGTVKHYYENGMVQVEYNLKEGKLNGTYKQFNQNGSVKFSYRMSQGKVAETLKVTNSKNGDDFSPNVSNEKPPAVKNPITKGVTFFPEGYNKVYNENDEIWLDGNFKEGQLYDGKVYIYSKNGLLKQIKIFKEGKFHSIGQN
jgi:antitoxin component YwqK of YwqJK toxin-antitoxin module